MLKSNEGTPEVSQSSGTEAGGWNLPFVHNIPDTNQLLQAAINSGRGKIAPVFYFLFIPVGLIAAGGKISIEKMVQKKRRGQL